VILGIQNFAKTSLKYRGCCIAVYWRLYEQKYLTDASRRRVDEVMAAALIYCRVEWQ